MLLAASPKAPLRRWVKGLTMLWRIAWASATRGTLARAGRRATGSAPVVP